MNEQNLIPNSERTPEQLKEQTRKGGIASGKARRKKKMMSQIYAEFLEREHGVVGKDGVKKNMSGGELLSSVMSKILSRGDSASVSLMREIREATEGNKLNVDMTLNEEAAKEIQDLFGVEMNEFNKSRPAPTGKQKVSSEDN